MAYDFSSFNSPGRFGMVTDRIPVGTYNTSGMSNLNDPLAAQRAAIAQALGITPQQTPGLDFDTAPKELQDFLGLGGMGQVGRGVNAFMGSQGNNTVASYNPINTTRGADGETIQTANSQPLMDLAQRLGYQMPQGFNPEDIQQTQSLYNGMNNELSDIYSIYGINQDAERLTGKDRASTQTLYRQQGNSLNPISPSNLSVAPKKGGSPWQEPEFLSALSVVLPAFGGWAGILGQGTAGTLTASGGLGLTGGLSSTIGSGLTNAAVNAGMNSMLTGSGIKGFGTSMLGSMAGAGVNSLMGGNGLSNMFDTSGGSAPLPNNPMGAFRGGMGALGLGGSALGMGLQGLGLANSAYGAYQQSQNDSQRS